VQEWIDAGETIENPDTDATPTKYGTYVLPGGTNYREVLLTLPAAPKNSTFLVTPNSE
jgi:hypothetical protein